MLLLYELGMEGYGCVKFRVACPRAVIAFAYNFLSKLPYLFYYLYFMERDGEHETAIVWELSPTMVLADFNHVSSIP
jgi:hypothetical protein